MRAKREFKKIGNYVYDPNSEALGQGTYGTVFKGVEFTNKENKVAIKRIHKSMFNVYRDLGEMDFLDREMKILKRIKGKNIVRYIDSFTTNEGNLYLITKFYKDGNLEEFMRKSGGKLPLEKALKILKIIAQVFASLKELDLRNENGEKKTLIHRDLKPENILMEGDEPVIADFGFAKFILEEKEAEMQKHTIRFGTKAYMSPQLLSESSYSHKCDVWSMGIKTYEMIYGVRPWKGDFAFQLLEGIKNQPLTFPEEPEVPSFVKELIQGMLEIEEAARYDWSKVVKVLEESQRCSSRDEL